MDLGPGPCKKEKASLAEYIILYFLTVDVSLCPVPTVGFSALVDCTENCEPNKPFLFKLHFLEYFIRAKIQVTQTVWLLGLIQLFSCSWHMGGPWSCVWCWVWCLWRISGLWGRKKSWIWIKERREETRILCFSVTSPEIMLMATAKLGCLRWRNRRREEHNYGWVIRTSPSHPTCSIVNEILSPKILQSLTIYLTASFSLYYRWNSVQQSDEWEIYLNHTVFCFLNFISFR